MKKSKFSFHLLIVSLFLLAPKITLAKTWGLGAVVGAPTGLSVNYFYSEYRTLHSTLAYNFSGQDSLQLASHYTWRRNTYIDETQLGWFYGVGARLGIIDEDDRHDDDDIELGPSATLGIFHEFQDTPLEIFLKGNLTVNVIEDTDVEGDLMLGLHYNL